jgi:uncharacterized membrane protein
MRILLAMGLIFTVAAGFLGYFLAAEITEMEV